MAAHDLSAIRRRLEASRPEELSRADRRAAVAAVLRQGAGEPEVLLIRRAEHPEDPWSGHMAFPGGRHDPTDRDLIQTAVRETLEELGLDLEQQGRLLGRLDDVEAVARGKYVGMVISPFVFELSEPGDLRPNYEVAEALWVPLGPLYRGEANTIKPYVHDGVSYEFPAYEVEGHIVWGLTYKMLQLFFGLLRSHPSDVR